MSKKDTKKIYAGYIGYAVRNLFGGHLPKSDYVNFLQAKLGQNYTKSDEKDLSRVASLFYYAHFLSLSLRIDPWDVIKSKSADQVKCMLTEVEQLKEKYHLSELSVVYYLDTKKVHKHMDSFQEPTFLKDILEGKIALKQQESESSESEEEEKPIKTYTITELRKLAADKKIVGRSKMGKDELIKVLKL